jgi:hypothetical protein
MNFSKHGCAFALLSTFVGLAAGATGCSASPSDNGTVSGHGEIINHTKSALHSGDITAIRGTYGAGCKNHTSGTDGWSVNPLTHSTLDVPKGNSDCVLTMTGLTASDTDYVGVAGATIAMGADYKLTATAFKAVGLANDVVFYGNAMLTPADFSDNFAMSVLVSDDIGLGDAGAAPAPSWAVYSGSASAGTIPAPNYTFDFTAGSFALTKNSDNTVDTATGYAELTEGSNHGEDYAIVAGSPTTFDEVDAAWNGTTISGGSLGLLHLAASGFGLVGADLTSGQPRTVIIRHTDTDSSVSSYQIFAITFTP